MQSLPPDFHFILNQKWTRSLKCRQNNRTPAALHITGTLCSESGGFFPATSLASPFVRNHSWRTPGKSMKTELLYATKGNDGCAVRQQPLNEQRWAGGKWKETKVNKHGNLEYVGQSACSQLSLRLPAGRTLWTTLKIDVAVKTAALAPTYTEGFIQFRGS